MASGQVASVPSQAAPAGRVPLGGVFSRQEILKIGAGTTSRKAISKTYVFAQEEAGGTVRTQPINKNFVPSGAVRSMGFDEFVAGFEPEPEFYQANVRPRMRGLAAMIDKGDAHRGKGEVFSAELEYQAALSVDEGNVRANFGLGPTYLERGEADRAKDMFERLVGLEAAFDPGHAHLFNEFGVALRRQGMLAEAHAYYAKAEGLCAVDGNLLFNIARCHFDQGDFAACARYLGRALELAPGLEVAARFMKYLEEKGLLPESSELPDEVSADGAA